MKSSEWPCSRGECKSRPHVQRKWGCKEPVRPGSGVMTVLGDEILSCPFRAIPANVGAWIDAYNAGAAEHTWSDAWGMSLLLVDAIGIIKATHSEILEDRK